MDTIVRYCWCVVGSLAGWRPLLPELHCTALLHESSSHDRFDPTVSGNVRGGIRRPRAPSGPPVDRFDTCLDRDRPIPRPNRRPAPHSLPQDHCWLQAGFTRAEEGQLQLELLLLLRRIRLARLLLLPAALSAHTSVCVFVFIVDHGWPGALNEQMHGPFDPHLSEYTPLTPLNLEFN